jgi:hypothetical protein
MYCLCPFIPRPLSSSSGIQVLDCIPLDSSSLDYSTLDSSPLDFSPLDSVLSLDSSPLDSSSLDSSPLDSSPLLSWISDLQPPWLFELLSVFLILSSRPHN